MTKTRYQKIINYDSDLYTKMLGLKKERDKKRNQKNKIDKFLKIFFKKKLPLLEIDKTPIFNRVKKYLNVNDDELNSLIEEAKSLVIDDQDIETVNNFWFSPENMKKWFILNILGQFNEVFVYSFIIDYFKTEKIKLMDYACGTATLSLSLIEKMNIEKLDLFELDNYIGKYLKQNSDDTISYYNILEDEITEQYDAIMSIDVLEHLPNSSEALIKMHKALKKGGILVLHAPFELDDPSHIPEAANDFFNNKGFEFLCENFKMIHDRNNEFLISAIYQKK